MSALVSDRALGLYLHIPFCERKCPYCDFNTYAGLNGRFQETVDALCLEMERWREPLNLRYITSIFMGGGTPTVLDSAQLEQLFDSIHRCFKLSVDCEITSEANPGTVDRAKFATLHKLGVNRLSLGVQSFQPDELAFLGRIHNVEDVLRAFAAAREVGFTNINLDFIFGLPNQPVEKWAATLEQALALAPDHLSLYSLIVEANTPLFQWVESGQVAAPDDDLQATHYEHALTRLAQAGYLHYEVSNWARPTEMDCQKNSLSRSPSLASRHNLVYWRNQEYLGIGPGAHSFMRNTDALTGGYRWGNRKPVPSYIKRINAGEAVEEFSEAIDARLSMGETMMLGLRLVEEGVGLDRFAALHGVALPIIFAAELEQLRNWQLIDQDDGRVRLTRAGLMLGNQIFAKFLPEK